MLMTQYRLLLSQYLTLVSRCLANAQANDLMTYHYRAVLTFEQEVNSPSNHLRAFVY